MPGRGIETRRSPAFTLIELLVVVAIIALLISILLPTLGAAREQAKTMRCGTALAQIGVGSHACRTENNGYGPTWDDGECDPALKGTVEWMLTWVDVLFDMDYLSDPKAGICPKDQRPDEICRIIASGDTQGGTQRKFVRVMGVGEQPRFGVRTSYALNAHMHFNFPGDWHDDASRQVEAVDGWWTWFGSLNAAYIFAPKAGLTPPGPGWFPAGFGSSHVAWRHGNDYGAQVLYRDGHVQLLKPRVPKDMDELMFRTVDTTRSFTWMPGENPTRNYKDYYGQVAGSRPYAIQEYLPEALGYQLKPEWLVAQENHTGKVLGGTDNRHPFGFPEELSAAWRTDHDAWRKLPNDPEGRQ